MRTSNPALSDKVFKKARAQVSASGSADTMSIGGTVNKSFLLLAMVLATAVWSFQEAFPSGWGSGQAAQLPGWYWPAMIGGFVLAMVIVFKQTLAPYLAPIYALAQGLILGAVSALFEASYPGIVLQAVLCTLAVFLALLIVYRSGLIKVTRNFRLGLIAATGGIALVYLFDIGLRFFGMNVPFIHSNGLIGIGVSLFIVVIAALNLVLDFDFIERGADAGAPKYMEWYAAFGLLVTLIWLYLEILRLLGKARSR